MSKWNARRRRLAWTLQIWRRDVAGVSAIEFALLSPLFGLVLAGLIDLGGALYTQFGLNAAVSAGANYAVVNAAEADSTSGATLASNIATIVASSQSTNWATSSVTVNNGPTGSGGGTASNADSCYCPTGTAATSITWGSAETCGSTCPSGTGVAGKFVLITASRAYAPFFPAYKIIENQTITASTIVQVQ